MRGVRLLVGALFVCLALLLPAGSALATFHLIYVSEVHPGSLAQPESSFVELEMYDDDEHFVINHSVTLHDATGATVGTFTFPAHLPGPSISQQTILVGDDGVEAAFGVKPDLLGSALNIPAAGGAVCWDSLDCVSWGNFSGSTAPSSGVPVDPPGIPDGSSIERRISRGTCANLLDEQDDSDDSDTDFVDGVPSPQSYATVPAPPACVAPTPAPVVTIDSKPASPTTSTNANFTFHGAPAATSFECRLDLSAYAKCDSGAIAYGPLAEGIHTFRVRGANANGTGSSAIYGWKVDLTAPSASLTAKPNNPSPGKTASFRFSSNEAGSKFECRLEPLEPAFAACNTQPKVYSNLTDGDYEFLLRAIDPAGNTQPLPTAYPWTVDNSLEDKTPPETAIDSKPPDPSGSPVASFTYSSNEPGSSFQCKLDSGNFNSCPAAGVAYSGLAEGAHTFQVRAIDSSGNTDPSPAGYSFSVVLAAPAATGSLTSGASPAPKPQSRPNTTIAKASAKTRDRTPTFRFGSSQSAAKFQCKLDGGPFVACRSPFTAKKLAYGKHLLQVRAVLGQASDPTPAKLSFKVVKR